jgi:Lon-like ATP-dependent protease
MQRTFFWNGDDNDKKSKDALKSSSSESDNDSAESSDDSSTVQVVSPSRLGFGDEAPRYPHLTAVPVLSRPLFPGIVTSITLTDPETIAKLETMSKPGGVGGYVGVFLRKGDTGSSVGGASTGMLEHSTPELITDPKEFYNVGTFAQIHRVSQGMGGVHADGTNDGLSALGSQFAEDPDPSEPASASILLMAHRRIDLLSVDNIGPPIDVTVSHWDRLTYKIGSDSTTDDTIRALSNEVLSIIRELAQLNPLFREHVTFFPTRVDANDPYRLADFGASLTTGSAEELQGVLEEKDPERRLHKALVLLTKEKEVSKLQKEISAKVEEKMTETQRRYMLTEQLKSIKKELGMEKDDKEALLAKYRKQLSEHGPIPQEANETIEAELEKLSTLEKNSSEFNVTRSYLDWLCAIPWGKSSEENFDIQDARKILNRDHYGLEEVKDIILEFIAVGKMKGTVQGKILCLSGPPGVGKTSIAESVADALGRKFFRFSVGGLSDVSEIKGHRRTYVGAMPGKVIQCLKSTGTTNPLVLIDEIDKLGIGHRGDPAAALLEVLVSYKVFINVCVMIASFVPHEYFPLRLRTQIKTHPLLITS